MGPLALLLLWACLLLLPTPAPAACDQVEPASMLPEPEACPDLARDGEVITAHTLEELMEIIDGGAFLYAQYGFLAAAFQNYAGEVGGQGVSGTFSLFNQGTSENAAALYNDPGSGTGDPLPGWPGSGEARLRVAFGTVSLQFHESCFYAALTLFPTDEQGVPPVRCLAERSVVLIQGAVPARGPSWGAIKAGYR